MLENGQDAPLVVPEVNPEDIIGHSGIIANQIADYSSSCSFKAIDEKFKLKE